MNYQKIYECLVKTRKMNTTPDSYHETHHIVPTSLSGSNDPENLVRLTAREHYVAHRLLEKITDQKYGFHSKQHNSMLDAMWLLSHDKIHKKFINSRTYEYLKKERSIALSKQMSGENNPMYGKNIKDHMTPEKYEQWKKNIKAAGKRRIGRKFSKETCEKISAKKKGQKHTEETKNKISKKLIGFKRPESVKIQIGNSLRGKKKPPRSDEHKKHLGQALKGKCAGEKNGSFGRKWMFHPITQHQVYAYKHEIDVYLKKGYVFGLNEERRQKNKGNFVTVNGKRKFVPLKPK